MLKSFFNFAPFQTGDKEIKTRSISYQYSYRVLGFVSGLCASRLGLIRSLGLDTSTDMRLAGC